MNLDVTFLGQQYFMFAENFRKTCQSSGGKRVKMELVLLNKICHITVNNSINKLTLIYSLFY